MGKALDVLLLLLAIISLCVIMPLNFEKQKVALQQQTQYAYEADQLAWEIQTFHKIDSSVLPSPTMSFRCYDDSMEIVDILSEKESYDFSIYFCVVFEYHGERRGVYIE